MSRKFVKKHFASKLINRLEKVWFCPWIFYLITLAFLSLLIYLVLFFNPVTQIYKNFNIDKNAVKVSDANPSSLGVIRLNCSKEVSFKNGTGTFTLKNPANASNNLILKLRITVDDDTINKLKKLKGNVLESLQFDEKNKSLCISETDCIPPGYNLTKLKMKSLPNGSDFPSDTYDGIMQVQTYTYKTNDKSFVNSEIPLKVHIK